jgi:hypothetical protein
VGAAQVIRFVVSRLVTNPRCWPVSHYVDFLALE